MSGDQLTIVLLGAFWAGTSAVYTAIKNTNEVRDKIVAKKISDRELYTVDLWHLLIWDWLPLKMSIAAISFVLGVLILKLPSLADQQAVVQGFRSVCYVASSVPFAGFSAAIITGIADYRMMRRHINHVGPDDP